jgi:GT2 family glycosyltransferase
MVDPKGSVESELACIVLSLGNEPGLLDAVRSLTAQQPPPEIVVVNSGGGGAEASLGVAGLDVTVIERDEILTAGAVRNLGIRATSAPYVSFLAADCIAEPGWVASRLSLHNRGARAVASLITNPYPNNASATAAQLFFYFARMEATPVRARKLYGVSYDRTLFAELGTFREDLHRHEDGEFNRRVDERFGIEWTPEVRTAHRHPQTLKSLVAYCYTRAAREVWARKRVYGRSSALNLIGRSASRIPRSLSLALRANSTRERLQGIKGWPLVIPAAFAYIWGTVFASVVSEPDAPRPQRVAEEALDRSAG